MKKPILLLCMLLTFLASCENRNDDPAVPEMLSPQKTTCISHDIMVNILTSRFGGYKKGSSITRASRQFSLTPYIDKGDTLLYIAQYEDGWEVYSAHTAAPMIVMSSDKGVFDMESPELPQDAKEFIKSYAESIRSILGEELPVDRSWGPLSVTEEELANAKVICHKNPQTRSVQSDDYLEGDWFLIETEELSKETYTSPKLITTIWGQKAPWNKYAKSLTNSEGELEVAPAGCSAVAIGQYMYYTHFKDNIPIYAVTKATSINNGTDYTFSGSSSTVWNDMMPNAYLYDVTEVAIFLGKLGRDLNADYQLDGTGVLPESEISFLNKTYNTTFTIESVNYSKIKKSIDKQYPLLACAGSDKGNHLFLIDQYIERRVTTKYVYGLIRDKWDGDGDDPYQDNEVDEEGNIVGFSYTKEVIHNDVDSYITMNWGENGKDNGVTYNPNAISWVSNRTDYNRGHVIYVRSDIR